MDCISHPHPSSVRFHLSSHSCSPETSLLSSERNCVSRRAEGALAFFHLLFLLFPSRPLLPFASAFPFLLSLCFLSPLSDNETPQLAVCAMNSAASRRLSLPPLSSLTTAAHTHSPFCLSLAFSASLSVCLFASPPPRLCWPLLLFFFLVLSRFANPSLCCTS